MPSDPPGESSEQPDELARLPHGRHGLPPEFVAHNQRQRLLASLIFTVAEQGYNETTITRIIEGASVSSRTFYKYFADVEAAYLAAFDAAAESIASRLAEAWDAEEDPLRVRASLAALLELFAGSPDLARLCLVEPFVAGPAVSRHYQEQIERLAPYLRQGRELREDSGGPFPETTERGLLGSIGAQIGRKVSAGEAGGLPGLLPDLLQFALTPYLGAIEARRIALLGD